MNPTASLRHELCSELGKTLCNRAFDNSLQSRVIICLWKMQIRIGYRVSNKFQIYTGTGPHKPWPETLASQVEGSIESKCSEYGVYYNIQFSMATAEFFNISVTYDKLYYESINIVFKVGKYHSWPNTIPVWSLVGCDGDGCYIDSIKTPDD